MEFYIFITQQRKMQEEVAKHTKKIYQAMKNPGHSF
jgi:hypothetical protein